jgi:fibronectin-binding autotransporter adhesin
MARASEQWKNRPDPWLVLPAVDKPKKPMIHSHTPVGRAALLAAATSLVVIAAAPAAVKTWDGAGADDNWQTGQNWNADTAPAADDQLVFAGTTRPTPSNDFTAGTSFNGVTVSAAAAAFTLSGNGINLTRPISAGGVAVSGGTIINNSANPLTLALPVNLASGKQSITSPAGSGGINFSGAFTRNTANSTVFTRSGGAINFTGSGLANDASGILGGWAVIGDDWATLNGSDNIVAYTGYTMISSGAITTGPNVNYRYTDESGDLTAATGTTIHTLQAKIGANRNLVITGQMRLSPNGGIYRLGTSTANSVFTVSGAGSTLTVDGGGQINLWDATTTAANFAATFNNLQITSPITNDGASPVSVNITGYVALGAANSYSGGCFINQGRVQASNSSAYGTGPVTVYPGGQAFLNSSSGTFANSITVSGNGPTETNGGVNDGAGAIRLGTGSTLSGTLTLAGATRLTTNSTGAGGTISGRITGSGALQVGAFATSGAIMNLSNIGTANDWTGGLTVSSLSNQRAFTLRLGTNEQIPDANNVTITAVSPSVSTFELNGFSETIGGLNSAVNSTLLVVSNNTNTSTLTMGAGNANGDFGGVLRDKLDAPASTLNLVKTGSGKQILRGTTTIAGTTTVNGGILESIGPVFGATGNMTVNTGGVFTANGAISCSNVTLAGGTLRPSLVDGGLLFLEGNLTLDPGAILDLNTASFPDAPVAVAGTVAPSGGPGSVVVNLSGPEPAVGQHPLVSYGPSGSLGGTGISAFSLGQGYPRMVASIIDDPFTQAVVLDVTQSGISAVWTGSLSSEWSTATLGAPKNWVLSSAPLTTTDFLPNDSVIFNDSASNNTIDISVADVTASSVTFDNTDDDYLLTGSKGITGGGQLIKDGEGLLEISNPNTYTGGSVITAGTLLLTGDGSLGTGEVVNDSLLEIDKSSASTLPNVIAGVGGLHHTGTGTTTLSGASSYLGDTLISAGTVRVTNSTALGSTPGGSVQVLAGAAVDIAGNPVNNQDFGAKHFLISGNGPTGTGALVNSGTIGQLQTFELVSLEADASIGGTGRFDLRGGGTPVLDLNGHTLRKRGTNQITIVGGIMQEGGTIIVEQGLFALETSSSSPGSGSVIFEPGTFAGFFRNDLTQGGITWPYTLREGVSLGNASAELATVPAPIILEGNVQFTGYNAGAPDPTFNRPLTLSGNITENGGSYSIAKNGLSVVTLTGTNSTYTGATLVNAGTLVVDGTLTASPVTVASGATLGGTGTLGGSLAGNGVVSPGMALVGTLGTGAATLGATGTLGIQIDSGATTSDRLAVTGSLNLGAASLALTDLGAATLPAGTKLVIATYTGTLSGAFANAPDGSNLILGPNTFHVDYDDNVLGENAITLTTPTGTPYDAWATLNGLTAGNNGRLDDPDNDGLENMIEFGLDGSPLSSASDGKVRAATVDVDPGAGVDNAFTLTFPVRTGAVFAGPGDLVSGLVDSIVYSVQGSTGLNDFTTLDVTEVTPALSGGLPALSTGWTYRSFRLPGSPGSPNLRAFLRVDVAEP